MFKSKAGQKAKAKAKVDNVNSNFNEIHLELFNEMQSEILYLHTKIETIYDILNNLLKILGKE